MKTTSKTTSLYQLFLEQVNSCSAIALPFCLALASAPVMAQDNTIELQDADSPAPSTEQPSVDEPNFNYRDLPPLEDQNIPSSGNQNQNVSPLPPANVEFATEETDYTLGPGDLINLDIFQVEEYSGEYPVLVDGTISLPLVGRVNVKGMSLKETSEAVSEKYVTYLKRPIITVGLVAPRPLRIGISGEVDNPGAYEVTLTPENPQFPTDTDLLEQAGGINTIADIRDVRVTRKIGNENVVFRANLWDLLTKGQVRQDISLRDGDDIFVPTTDKIYTNELERMAEASFGLQSDKPIKVAVVGEVYRPGSHFVQPELLSRNNDNNGANQGRRESIPPRLSQAIGAANGIKPLADIQEVEVRRTSWDGEEKVIAVNLWEVIRSGDTSQDIILQEGDRVIIPKADKDKVTKEDTRQLATATFSPETITVNVVGEVTTPGPVEVEPNTPMNQAILAAGGFDSTRAQKGKVELISLQPDGTVDKREIEVDLGAEVNDETNPVLGQNDVVVVGRSGAAGFSDQVGQLTSPFQGLFGLFRAIF